MFIFAYVDHLVKVLASKYPGWFGWCYRYSDELYLALDTFLQYNSLKTLGASFSEYFYGLKRVTADGRKLTSKLRVVSLLALVVTPYIERKVESLYEQCLVLRDDGLLNDSDMMSRMLNAFLSIYPYIHMTWSGVVFSYLMRFLLQYSDVHSPLLHFCKVKLVSLSASDLLEDSTVSWSDVFSQGSVQQVLKSLLTKLTVSLPHYVYQLFSSAIFFLQFLQWYSNYTQSEGETRAISVAASIPAPKVETGSDTVVDKLSCPVCKRVRTNSAALSTSGYVFCYPCIYRHVQRQHSCPVTGFYSNTDHIIKLYVNNDLSVP
ncbi:PEX12 [Bugula neritina]|uniref:Peroxisome assembly protein 12 n=1 Tax=Bugula neritina TaxID=10212 RepID=A0A7J7KG39_BUGNE|nr:PEX12 [Bugula neritina]